MVSVNLCSIGPDYNLLDNRLFNVSALPPIGPNLCELYLSERNLHEKNKLGGSIPCACSRAWRHSLMSGIHLGDFGHQLHLSQMLPSWLGFSAEEGGYPQTLPLKRSAFGAPLRGPETCGQTSGSGSASKMPSFSVHFPKIKPEFTPQRLVI